MEARGNFFMHPVSFRFPPRLSQLVDLTKTGLANDGQKGVTKGGRFQATFRCGDITKPFKPYCWPVAS